MLAYVRNLFALLSILHSFAIYRKFVKICACRERERESRKEVTRKRRKCLILQTSHNLLEIKLFKSFFSLLPLSFVFLSMNQWTSTRVSCEKILSSLEARKHVDGLKVYNSLFCHFSHVFRRARTRSEREEEEEGEKTKQTTSKNQFLETFSDLFVVYGDENCNLIEFLSSFLIQASSMTLEGSWFTK